MTLFTTSTAPWKPIVERHLEVLQFLTDCHGATSIVVAETFQVASSEAAAYLRLLERIGEVRWTGTHYEVNAK